MILREEVDDLIPYGRWQLLLDDRELVDRVLHEVVVEVEYVRYRVQLVRGIWSW